MKFTLSRRLFLFMIVIVVVIAALVPSFYFYSKYREAQKILQNPAEIAKAENKALIERISKIIVLPEDEEPDVRTVTRKEDVVGQPFFAQAENGDRVLVYAQAKKAFLYRPSTNKIINVAPINLNPTPTPSLTKIIEGTPSANLTPTTAAQVLRFFLLNGTTKVGLTKSYEEVLKKTFPAAIIVDRDNAKKNDYEKTLLIAINLTKAKEADQIASSLGISVEKLPEGEIKPSNTDFLIILGVDKENL